MERIPEDLMYAKYTIDVALEGDDDDDDELELDVRDEMIDELREENSTDYSQSS